MEFFSKLTFFSHLTLVVALPISALNKCKTATNNSDAYVSGQPLEH